MLNFIDRLPRHSGFGEALADDEQLAGAMLKRSKGDDGRPPTRRMRDWTPEVELLSLITDRLAELIQVVGATKGAKPKPVQHQPRPVTAMQRVRARKRKSKHESVVARMLPNRPVQPDRPVGAASPAGYPEPGAPSSV